MDLSQVSPKDFEAAVQLIEIQYHGNAYLTMGGASLEVTPEKSKKNIPFRTVAGYIAVHEEQFTAPYEVGQFQRRILQKSIAKFTLNRYVVQIILLACDTFRNLRQFGRISTFTLATEVSERLSAKQLVAVPPPSIQESVVTSAVANSTETTELPQQKTLNTFPKTGSRIGSGRGSKIFERKGATASCLKNYKEDRAACSEEDIKRIFQGLDQIHPNFKSLPELIKYVARSTTVDYADEIPIKFLADFFAHCPPQVAGQTMQWLIEKKLLKAKLLEDLYSVFIKRSASNQPLSKNMLTQLNKYYDDNKSSLEISDGNFLSELINKAEGILAEENRPIIRARPTLKRQSSSFQYKRDDPEALPKLYRNDREQCNADVKANLFSIIEKFEEDYETSLLGAARFVCGTYELNLESEKTLAFVFDALTLCKKDFCDLMLQWFVKEDTLTAKTLQQLLAKICENYNNAKPFWPNSFVILLEHYRTKHFYTEIPIHDAVISEAIRICIEKMPNDDRAIELIKWLCNHPQFDLPQANAIMEIYMAKEAEAESKHSSDSMLYYPGRNTLISKITETPAWVARIKDDESFKNLYSYCKLNELKEFA